jgi:hypothetical protein
MYMYVWGNGMYMYGMVWYSIWYGMVWYGTVSSTVLDKVLYYDAV